MNPLLEKFNTPYQTPPFSKIKNEHFFPAFQTAIELAKNEINAIVENNSIPTFENTIAAMDYSGKLLENISHIFFNLNHAETSEEIQKIAKEVSPLLSEFSNDVGLNQPLFLKIKAVYAKKESLNLNAEQNTLLEKTYKNFVRNGANLNETDKNKLREIDKQLSELSLNFGENVLAEINNYELLITNEADLSGLPEGVVEAAKLSAEQKNKQGWLFTLAMPSYLPFMTYADNRELRKQFSLASGKKASNNNSFDNKTNVLNIAQLRFERANLLGYQSHAHFILEEQMATSPTIVNEFLENLLLKAKPIALKEYDELCAFSTTIGGPAKLESWDSAYYAEKLKQKLFQLDDEQLKPYFKLENVIQGAFIVANKLYGLNFTEIFDVDKYHADVKTYKVTDEENNFVAIFYGDYFPRAGKRNGAWMTSFNSQFIENSINQRPQIINVCNFTKPTKTKPSLLTFNEVTTLFHEFGHALHGMLANTTYPSLSGTSVYRDFVELPSQLLENWCYEEEALKLFAHHYQTNEVIPMELIQKIKASSNFMEATAIVRQLNFGKLDMAWHTTNPEEINDVVDFEKKATESTRIYPLVDGICFSTSFAHIFQGGYSAGYYSYKWAEVLDADAFEFFIENGIFNRATGKRFQEFILSKGGSEHPMELYEKFRGKKPDSNALLKRAGLIA